MGEYAAARNPRSVPRAARKPRRVPRTATTERPPRGADTCARAHGADSAVKGDRADHAMASSLAVFNVVRARVVGTTRYWQENGVWRSRREEEPPSPHAATPPPHDETPPPATATATATPPHEASTDVAVPVSRLAQLVGETKQHMAELGVEAAPMFGHIGETSPPLCVLFRHHQSRAALPDGERSHTQATAPSTFFLSSIQPTPRAWPKSATSRSAWRCAPLSSAALVQASMGLEREN